MKNAIALSLAACTLFACGKDKKDEGKKTPVTTNVRSTGASALGLRNLSWLRPALVASDFLANSSVDVESFKIPIGRINLTAGDTGSGYSEASPNFYGCDGATNDDCMVDVVKTSIKDLLSYAAAARAAEKAAATVEASEEQKSSEPVEVELSEAKTYTGTAVEICAEGRPGGDTFKAKLKASGVLGATTYYTNKASGVSTTGPAEEIEISMPCMGRNSDLLAPIELEPEVEATLVFWAEPAGSVLLTNNGPMVNSNCYSKTAGEVTFCAGLPPFFGTTVAGDAKAEKFHLDVTTVPTRDPSGFYADMLATVVFDANGTAFGGLLRQIYTNTVGENKLMHAAEFEFNSVVETDGKIEFKYLSGSDTDQKTLFKDMPRKAAGTGLTMSELVEETVTMNSTPL